MLVAFAVMFFAPFLISGMCAALVIRRLAPLARDRAKFFHNTTPEFAALPREAVVAWVSALESHHANVVFFKTTLRASFWIFAGLALASLLGGCLDLAEYLQLTRPRDELPPLAILIAFLQALCLTAIIPCAMRGCTGSKRRMLIATSRDRHCPCCRYNLSGLTSPGEFTTCPECGFRHFDA